MVLRLLGCLVLWDSHGFSWLLLGERFGTVNHQTIFGWDLHFLSWQVITWHEKNSKIHSNSSNQLYTTLGWANSPTRKTENIWNLWEIVPTTNYQLSILCTPCPRLIGALCKKQVNHLGKYFTKIIEKAVCLNFSWNPLNKQKKTLHPRNLT